MACAVLSSCASTTTATGSGVVAIVATNPIVADFARQVGGRDVEVRTLVKANVDPHDHEPSPADLEALRQADIVIRNGVGLEPWLDTMLAASGTAAAVVDASTGVTIHAGAEGDHGDDPHIWHDPRNAVAMVDNIAAAMVTTAPGLAGTFRANATRYDAELDALDHDLERQFATLTNTKLVTNHDAFGYLVARYGLEFVGSVIPSFDTSAELSVKEVSDLVAAIKAQGVAAVFSEGSLPAKAARAIAHQAGVHVIDGPNALYGDSLGAVGSGADTYVAMMRHNASVIVGALSGQTAG